MNKPPKKHPKLYFRYAEGLGDLIACVLHSKLVGWLTKALTGKDRPCTTCSKRILAYNYICPIPVWKLFFPNKKGFQEKLKAEMDLYSPGWDNKGVNIKDYTPLQSIKHHYDSHLFEIIIYYKNNPSTIDVEKRASLLPLDIPHFQQFNASNIHKSEIDENFIFVSNCNFHQGDFYFKVNYYIIKEESYGNYDNIINTGK